MTMGTHEKIQAGKALVTLSHGTRLTYTDVDGIERRIEHDPAVVRLFRAMQLGSGDSARGQTVKTEGREKSTNQTGDPIFPSYHAK